MDRPPETIPELLAARVADAADRPWLFFEDQRLSHAEIARSVARYAAGLAARGVTRGDTVALVAANRPETIFTWFAANHLGAKMLVLNPALKTPEQDAMFAAAQARVVLRSADEAAAIAIDAPPPPVAGRPDDVAVLLATSGTTGAPKLIPQTHRVLALTAEAVPAWLGLTADDRLMTALPLFHINAQAYSTLGSLGAGAALVLVPKFSASRFFEDAKRTGATVFNAVGAMINILLATEPRPADRDHRLRLCYSALALPEAQHRAFEERFGVRMIVGYGMSETTFGTIWPLDQPPRYGTMGVLRQHPRLGVVNEAKLGDDGELFLKNPATKGEWLATGDIVKRDSDGWFTFVSRKKDVIRRRGENVAAGEVEAVLLQHPAVLEAAVVAVASKLGEDEIVAYVAPKANAAIDVESITAFCKERLADFKVPSVVHVRESLPKTPTERIAKHLLR
jgi:crotonobetaine/carnitine-CoA ligase